MLLLLMLKTHQGREKGFQSFTSSFLLLCLTRIDLFGEDSNCLAHQSLKERRARESEKGRQKMEGALEALLLSSSREENSVDIKKRLEDEERNEEREGRKNFDFLPHKTSDDVSHAVLGKGFQATKK